MRLFFALWPEDRVRLALAPQRLEAARATSGRPTMPVTLHLTLAFLGNVLESRLPELKKIAQQIDLEAFDYTIDLVGCFEQAGVAWLASEDPPDQLYKLQQTIHNALLKAGFDVDLRKFRPHITVARNIDRAFEARPIPPIRWPIRQFSLVGASRDDHGVTYDVLESWPLRQPK
jgi:RNA 2',3'-cyclic 3'-phosphodiesterase